MKLPKLPQLNRSWLMFAGAIALGIVATGLSHKYLKDQRAQIENQLVGHQKQLRVVVATRDLPRGTRIDPAAFAPAKIPAEYVHASAIEPRRFREYMGQKLGAPIKKGEVLLALHLESTTTVFSSTLENGNRALTTEVDEVNSISGMLRPSDHIDLMATAHGSSSKGNTDTTFTLLSNVEVLATGQVTHKSDGTNQPHTYTTITLSVSPEDAERIVVAKDSGKLTAVLRSPDDTKPNTTTAMNIDDVLPKKPRDAKHPGPVQYIVGGRT
jgi:pilus assembly protein CpaB